MKTPQKALTTFLLLLILSAACFAQEEQNEEPRKRFSAGFTLLGPVGLFSFDLSYFATNHFNIEIGGGFVGVYGGLKYYTKPSKPFYPYLGVQVSYLQPIDVGGSYDWHYFLYIPVGIPIISNRNFSLSLELAFARDMQNQRSGHWVALKFRFF